MNGIQWDKVAKQGLFALLFVSLLVYTITENKKRETEYIQTIKEATAANAKYADIIKIDLADIKAKLPR